MARISKKTIQAVKDTVKISDVFEWLGTTVIHRGRNTMAFCPFCEDANSRNPGCSLDDDRGLFHCFAAETLVLTSQGLIKIEELSNHDVEILNGNGEWETVRFSSYGIQKLYAVSLTCADGDREIFATSDHRWFVQDAGEVLTKDLKEDMLLCAIYPQGVNGPETAARVISVVETKRIEEVYCCQTSSGSFALESNILTGNCFVCHASGDVISAVQQHEECSFPEAVELVANQFNVPVEYDESLDPAAESRRKKLVSVLEAAQEEFLAQRKEPHFNEFLKSRNLTQEAADRFELGMSLYTEADAVTSRLQAKFGSQALIDAGLCFANDDG